MSVIQALNLVVFFLCFSVIISTVLCLTAVQQGSNCRPENLPKKNEPMIWSFDFSIFFFFFVFVLNGDECVKMTKEEWKKSVKWKKKEVVEEEQR